MLIIKVTYCLR